MIPIKYIEQTRALFTAQGFPPYEWTVNDISPFTPFKKKLEECRVALLSAGGMYIKGEQLPFDPEKNDLTFREIPKDIDIKLLAVSHNNYDHTGADLDINCVFPIERLRELEVEGYIGELAPVSFTIMGRIFRRTVLQTEMAPEILRRLKDERVDIFFLVPA